MRDVLVAAVVAGVALAACGRSEAPRAASPEQFWAALALDVDARARECDGASAAYGASLRLDVGQISAMLDDATRSGRLR